MKLTDKKLIIVIKSVGRTTSKTLGIVAKFYL